MSHLSTSSDPVPRPAQARLGGTPGSGRRDGRGLHAPAPDGVLFVTSPDDLTGPGMPVSGFLDGVERPVVVDSLTSLLLYSETRAVFRFLSVRREARGKGVDTLPAEWIPARR